MSTKIDLNRIQPGADGNYPDVGIKDNSTASSDGLIKVYFRDIADRLLTHISEADAVFGCVAWLTHPEALSALSKKDVAIVVQKEDFLRPDLGAQRDWKRYLRDSYSKLRCSLDRYAFNNIISRLSTSEDPSVEAVRCVGNVNRDRAPAFPRMHNKFLIFAKVNRQEGRSIIKPYAVWTGSFNITKNAVFSLENALYITEPNIVDAYFQEFGQIFSLSEPLDWNSEWVEPEFRIGT